MKPLRLVGFLVAMALPLASATHIPDCTVSGPDGSTYWTIDTPDGKRYYCEERGNPFGTPIPLSGFFFGPDADGDGVPEFGEGEGTWCYEESNGRNGLQRGGIALFGDWFPPGCDQEWGPIVNWTTPSIHPENLPEGSPCIVNSEDPADDETCHSGPDMLIFGGRLVAPW